ncbi:utp6, partial [Symbiodinium microadriaticum]
MLGMLGRAGLWILLLRLQAGAGNAGAVDDECGHESGQSCTLQMLQHVAERRLRSYGPMHPEPSVVRWNQVPSGGRLVTGLLSVFLDPADAKSPQLELEIAMYFSNQQPAPLGALLLHCGGPGSDSSCLRYVWGSRLEGYDVWSISQRGIGPRADPALNCNNSHLPVSGCPATGCQISDFTDCPCALLDGTPQIGEIWADIDPQNETQVAHLLRKRDAWGSRCAASPKFQLTGANGKTYNFLEYVGSQFLSYDIDRFRRAIGAQKMSFYGYSYGTYVAGVYASAFSEFTGRVVLDGNMDPTPRKTAQATGDALANDKFIAFLLNTCKAAPDCPLEHPEEEYDRIVAAARLGNLTAPTKSGMQFPLTVGMLMAYIQTESASNSGRLFHRILETLAGLSPKASSETIHTTVAFILDGFCFVKGVSTWYNYDICVGPGQTSEDEEGTGQDFGEPYMQQCAVWGVDQAGYFDVPDLLRQWKSAASNRGDAGLAAVVGDMVGSFLWPVKATPNAPMGSSIVYPLVVGNLFDPATSYSWAQNMKSAFPGGSLITWQGIGHTFPSHASDYNKDAVKECQAHIKAYLQKGTMPVNGLTCFQVRYEIALEALRRRRTSALRWRKYSISTVAGLRRIHNILHRGSHRFKGDLQLWYQHVDFCLRSGSTAMLTRVLMRAVKYHPKEVHLWLLAADRELQQGHVEAARKLLLRGLRCVPTS